MSTHKRIDVICITAVILTIVLTVLLIIGKAFDIMPVMSEEAGSTLFTADDLNAEWDSSSATQIVLSDSGSMISGNGAYVYDGNVYIVYAGCYILTGELTNGSVIIDADKSDKIWVLLDGATIHCGDGAAIRVEQADNVFLTLADGTESTVSSGGQYSAENIASGVDGVIYSRDNLTINGTGALAVSTEYDHGIVCNDDLMITGGNITISAVQDGIHANDSVHIRNAAISISAGDDGISVSNDDETAFLCVESGSIAIPACYEGLEAVDITIAGGTIDIMATDDGINASGSGDNSVIRVAGGDITIINPSGRDADGLDSNGSIYIEGGKVFISVLGSGSNCALDYGSENGGECVVSGGTVIACGGSMMAEGFDAGSPQGFLIYNTAAEAGTAISLQDSAGRELLSEEIPCSFSSIVLSTPELKVGDTCMIVVDGIQEQIMIDNSPASGFGPAGMFGGDCMRNGRNHPPQSNDMWPEVKPEMKEAGRAEDALPVNGMMEPPGVENRPDMQGMRENGGRQSAPDPGQEITFSRLSADTLASLGISVFVLLTGLFIAVKMKY